MKWNRMTTIALLLCATFIACDDGGDSNEVPMMQPQRDMSLGNPSVDAGGNQGVSDMGAPEVLDQGTNPIDTDSDVPSGEDMAQIINFANRGNLIHIIFTLEGAYVVKVKNIPEKKDINRIENFFKKTHGFRGKNLSLHLSNFKKFLTDVIRDKKGDSVDLWLKMTNNITLEKIYKFENKKNTDKRKIFEVKLLNFNNGMNFKGNYISETCHKKYFTR